MRLTKRSERIAREFEHELNTMLADQYCREYIISVIGLAGVLNREFKHINITVGIQHAPAFLICVNSNDITDSLITKHYHYTSDTFASLESILRGIEQDAQNEVDAARQKQERRKELIARLTPDELELLGVK